MLNVGDKIPAFSLPDQTGTLRSFANLKGKSGLVLYVYPKDNTPGCTTEAQEFRDLAKEFEAKGFAVAGLSKDSVASHAKFAAKYELPFTLLSDVDKALLSVLGAWGEKIFCGKVTQSTFRNTYVFNSKGVLKKVYANVKAGGHAGCVLGDLG